MILKNLFKVIFGCFGILFLTNIIQTYGQTTDCKPFDFNLAPEYQAGPNAFSFASADLNGDGIAEVITPNSDAQTVSVLYGDGAGGFAPPRNFPTGTAVNTATAGDLNGDGKLDLIAAYFSGSKIVVLLNDGQGGFSAPAVTTFPSNVSEFYNLKAADFNGDGKADVAGVTRTNLNFFLGNGQGGLALNTTLPWIGYKSEMVVGNFNNDSMADLAVIGGDYPTNWELGVMLGNSSGAFAFNNRFPVTNQPSGIVIGEFNGDGLTDVAVAANYPYQNSTPQTFFMQPWFGNGAGGFAAGTKVFLPYTVYGLATGDFNGDGIFDLATSMGSMIATVNGVGDGTFQNKTYWATPASDKLLSVDANQDGKKDLLTIRNASPTGFLSVLLSSDNSGFLAPKAIAYGGTDIAAADFNNDNLLDMITVTDTSFAAPSAVVVALNSANGLLLPDPNFSMPIAMRALAVGDFNGDGNKDVVTAHSNNGRVYAVRLGDGTGNLGAPITQQWFNGVENLVVGDFNNDGKDDFLLIDGSRGYTRLSNGNGTFSGVGVEYNFDALDPFIIPQKGDFNSDGKLDLIISNGTTAKIWLGTGNGNFTLSDSQPFNAWRITVGDLNGDGNLDLIGFVSSDSETTLRAMLGNANGTFGASFAKTIPGSNAAQIISGDFNQDGFADVAYRSSWNQSVLTVVPSTGQAPYFGTPVFYSVAAISQHPFDYGSEATSIAAADYNADGKVDIGFTASPARAIIYNMTSQKPCISINDATVTEGDGGTSSAAFTVTLSAPSSQIARVSYTLQGQSATIGTDLQNASGRLEIPAGQTSATINIPITGDLIDEFDETFTINLSSPTNASIVDSVGAGTIIDNDAEPSLTVGDVSKIEGFSSQQYVFQINLSAPSGKPISFRYATANGTAVVGSDYLAVDTTRNVALGTTTIDVNVTVLGDSTFEPDENFLLNFSNPTNVALSDNQAQGTIVNDDSVPTVSIFSAGATEGDLGQIAFPLTVSLSNPTYLPVTVNFVTSDGTALAGSDYVANNGSITVAPEQQSATLNFQIIGDTINEPNELFNINIFNPVNAAIGNPQTQFQIFDDEFVVNDYDRDGKTDFAVFRPSDGTWYRLFSSNNSFAGTQYGASGDFPASGDYNGDGRTDITVWRPSNGVWHSTVPNRTQTWGTTGDTPVHGDYDNDSRIDLAVFRSGTGTWYIQQSFNNVPKYLQFGISTDVPVPADYDGDGKTDVAVFRPNTGIWYVLRSSDGAVASSQFGIATDKLVPADYDGDGRADIAVFRDGIWYVLRSSDGGAAFVGWGQAGDKPVPGNYDGDAKTDYAVYRGGVWYVLLSSNGSILTKQFGASDDIPVASVSNN